MGGNLFKLGRISQDKYLKIETEIAKYLDKKFNNAYLIPRYYSNKPDFGDLDIIINVDCLERNWETTCQEVVRDLNIQQYKSTGRVFSTVYQNFQVDYFTVKSKFFVSTYNYLSFNDLGNLIGKICRRFNLKYGEKGLAYVYRRELGNYKKDLLLTTDFKEITSFLKLDYDRWLTGFDDLEDIYQWVINSPYFSVEPYIQSSSKLNNRLKSRPTIQKFVEYLKKNKIVKNYPYLENREEYIPLLEQSFPNSNLIQNIKQEKKEEELTKQLITKFNGKIVIQLIPELSGKELGKFIVGFKEQFKDFQEFVLRNNSEEIKANILEYYQRHYCRNVE